MKTVMDLVERGLVPDGLIRWGIRRLLAARLRQENGGDCEAQPQALRELIVQLRHSPIALHPDKANEQHYELPPAFFQRVLGKRMKYSCGYWPPGISRLDGAEEAMLGLTCQRAQLYDGMDILELGCGWGSLSLWIAEHYPQSHILAVSNSRLQREFIEAECGRRHIANLEVITADMNDFLTERRFDRVVSVEMFEHMRNYEQLLAQIATWLRPEGKLFVHLFCHRKLAYPFETEGANNWLGRYFFTGGLMPCDNLLLYFQRDVVLENHWRLAGTHYRRTAEAWLANLDAQREEILSLLATMYGPQETARWFIRWRVFFLACAELFGYHKGQEWGISHYLFRRRLAAL